MKFKLNLAERINLMEILPVEGNFITLGIIREFKVNIGVKDKEFKLFGIEQKDNKITWKEEGNKEIDFDFGDKAVEIVIEELEKLDKGKKLEDKHFSLFTKFVKTKYEE